MSVTNLALGLIGFGGWFCGDWFSSYTQFRYQWVLFFSESCLHSLNGVQKVGMCMSVEYKADAYRGFIIVFCCSLLCKKYNLLQI